MYTWTIIAITVGCSVVIFQLLFFIALYLVYRKGNYLRGVTLESRPKKIIPAPTSASSTMSNLTFADPFTGNSMKLERVSSTGSLRSFRSVGFIEYERSEDGSIRGSRFPISATGSIKSDKLNRSMASLSSYPGEEKMKRGNVNPIFGEANDVMNPVFEEEAEESNSDPRSFGESSAAQETQLSQKETELTELNIRQLTQEKYPRPYIKAMRHTKLRAKEIYNS